MTDSLKKDRADTSSLVRGIVEGNTAMEGELVRRYRASLIRMLEYLTHDHARAEDLAQETLLIVLIKLRNGHIEFPERLSSFVHQTGRYCWLGWHRQNLRFDFCGDMNDQLDDSSIEQALIKEERCEYTATLIRGINVPRDREVLYRTYVCDEPKPTTCEALALSSVHFDRVISRAKSRLRDQVLRRTAESESALVD